MQVLTIIIIGFVAGLIARAVMPGKDSFGLIMTTLLGIGGAFVGSFVGQTAGWANEGEPAGIFTAIMGALLILFLVSFIRPRRIEST